MAVLSPRAAAGADQPAAKVPEQGAKAKAATGSCPFVRGQHVKLPGGQVNYLLQGPKSPAPLVVCIHGLNGSIASFSALEPELEAAGFRVLLFDLYGFGLSSASRGRLNPRTYVEELAGLLDALDLQPGEQCMLLGFSMGGIVAVEFAKRYPERVAKVLLVAPGGLLKKAETPCAPLLFGCLRTRLGCCLLQLAACLVCCCGCPLRRALRKDKAAGHFQPDVRDPDRFQDVGRENLQRFAWDIRRSVVSYLGAIKGMPLWSDDFRDSYSDLANSSIPVLFVWGDDDCTVPWAEVGDEVVELFKHTEASCIFVSGGGHGLLLEDAEEVGGYAAAWFSNSKESAWCQRLEKSKLSLPEALESMCTAPKSSSMPPPTALGAIV
mmetsp:Transcript_113230/g.365888  ORF Transcript_113230/g.365888 Transcript_113230/m.365888 type:complete len:380 (-) Transcript_113230:28-1167(-)